MVMQLLSQGHDFLARCPGGCVVSIGMYDGVHRGHAKALQQLRARAARYGLPSAVVTFAGHPRAVVRPDACPMLLSSLEDRLRLLAATGAVDFCLVLEFDLARSLQSAEEFVLRTLLKELGMRELVVGENFACGRGRQGDVAYLSALGRAHAFAVSPVQLDTLPGGQQEIRSSSTEARRLIQAGDLAGANVLLQRPHEMTATTTRESTGPRKIQAALGAAMCAPASDTYRGAVRHRRGDSEWIPALIQVGGEGVARDRTVRLRAESNLEAKAGDQLRIRFVDRARVAADRHPT
jgi:riboflavin kinase / FMN adenylyltransferase